MYITLERDINHKNVSSHMLFIMYGRITRGGGLSFQVVHPVCRLLAERQVSQCLQRVF